jgi:3-methylcrotonyl-CoA carboxylase alpha subunit
VGETSYSVAAKLLDGALELRHAGSMTRFTIASEPMRAGVARLWLAGAGGTHTWQQLDRWQRALAGQSAADAQHGDRLCAPMPGMVTAVKTSVGAQVSAGDPLVLMEAMKMVHTLSAPADGRVTEVRCRAGDAARGGDVLLVIESTPA